MAKCDPSRLRKTDACTGKKEFVGPGALIHGLENVVTLRYHRPKANLGGKGREPLE